MQSNLIKRLRNPAFFTETSERNLMNEAADALEEVIKEFENLQFLFHATYKGYATASDIAESIGRPVSAVTQKLADLVRSGLVVEQAAFGLAEMEGK